MHDLPRMFVGVSNALAKEINWRCPAERFEPIISLVSLHHPKARESIGNYWANDGLWGYRAAYRLRVLQPLICLAWNLYVLLILHALHFPQRRQ